ncbi:MAG: hypothetical protein RLZZ386_411 [Planctomycetota bacterium]
MLGIQRIFITAVIALWLPLCCCQVMAFANSATGADTETSCCSSERQNGGKHAETKSCCDDEETPSHRQPPMSCVHCATKAPPPTAPSLDSFFILSAVPFALVLPPSLIEPSTLHATEVAGCWDVPPPTRPPEIAMSANDRRSTFSIWII